MYKQLDTHTHTHTQSILFHSVSIKECKEIGKQFKYYTLYIHFHSTLYAHENKSSKNKVTFL